MRHRSTMLGLLVVAACHAARVPAAGAQERGLDPWLHERWQDATFADLVDAMQADEEAAGAGEARAPHTEGLWRWRMNGLESAQYSVAEHTLRRGDVAGAIALLEKVAAATTSGELRDVTHYNLAEICRRRLRDAPKARAHYAKVAGTLRHLARRRELGLLIQVGQLKQAAALADRRIAAATSKGARLAMLHALARAWTRHGMADRAHAVYQRIAEEFTPRDIEAILAAARKQAAATVHKLMARIDRGEDEDDLWDDMVEARLTELAAQGRWDEYHAFWHAAVDTWNKLVDDEERRDGEPKRRLLPRKA